MTPDEQIRRGQRAALILNDDTFKAGVQALRDRALESFRNAPAADVEALRMARLEYDITERLINEFTKFVADGHMSTIRKEAAEKSGGDKWTVRPGVNYPAS